MMIQKSTKKQQAAKKSVKSITPKKTTNIAAKKNRKNKPTNTANKQRQLKKKEFLAAFARTGNIVKAAQEVEINRASHYDWMEKDKRYAAKFRKIDEGLTRQQQREFLVHFAICGNILQAAENVGIERQKHYEWLNDPEYKKMFEDAKEDAADALEKEARRRAVEGVDEPVFYQGCVCGTVRKYSDLLLTVLLKGNRPDKYRETQPVNVEVNIDVADRMVAAKTRAGVEDAGQV
jgi:molybdenum-dependent DNA-binding transcriptional regulator ModE